MKFQSLFVILFAVAATTQSRLIDDLEEDPTYLSWSKYIKIHNREYSGVEYYGRKWIYNSRRRDVIEHNVDYEMKKVTYLREINTFSDWLLEELIELNGWRPMLQGTVPCSGNTYDADKQRNIPAYINWAEIGVVTPVQNQQRCGSDYAISAVGALESKIAIKERKTVQPLSVQNVLDCSSKYGNHGCNGGLPASAFEFIKMSNGIVRDDVYPYTGMNDECRYNRSTVGGKVRGCAIIKPGDEEELKFAVALEGPITIGFTVTPDLFSYKSGIYDNPDCGSYVINHSMLLVGYGTDEQTGLDYWIIKNSWGRNWGEDGYFRTVRGKSNRCGIASMPVVPIL